MADYCATGDGEVDDGTGDTVMVVYIFITIISLSMKNCD
jgi:hypothetical protein